MNDPLILPPRLWFGVLCHGIGKDAMSRINLQGVFNQVALLTPAERSGVAPNAFLNSLLAVGFSGGLGHFTIDIDLRDMDNNILWERPEGPWEFNLGPGEQGGAILAQQVQYWFTQRGQYYFLLRSPDLEDHRILFEVAEKIGPPPVQDAQPPESPKR